MKYIDLKISNDDLALDQDGLPLLVADRDSIAQDIRHAIRESGYLVDMIAERSSERRSLLRQKIILLVEDDERIIPGTVSMEAASEDMNNYNWRFSLTAETVEYSTISFSLQIES